MMHLYEQTEKMTKKWTFCLILKNVPALKQITNLINTDFFVLCHEIWYLEWDVLRAVLFALVFAHLGYWFVKTSVLTTMH